MTGRQNAWMIFDHFRDERQSHGTVRDLSNLLTRRTQRRQRSILRYKMGRDSHREKLTMRSWSVLQGARQIGTAETVICVECLTPWEKRARREKGLAEI